MTRGTPIPEAPLMRDGQNAREVVDQLRTAPAHTVLIYDQYGK